jgi:FtsP/CotA-like multicopper oxidase with cupredoxin domain
MPMKKALLYLAASCCITLLHAQTYYNPLAIPSAVTGTNFVLTVADTSHNFFGAFQTPTYGINGSYLGPTLVVNKDDSVNIAVQNTLAQSTTIHWHGMHIPAEMDGGPHTVIPAASTWNVGFRIRNEASTCWYHPHLHMNTGTQVYMGLAGMIIVKDTVEAALNLPRTYGTDDIPVVLQDRTFNTNGDFIIDGLADSMVVNGTMHPYLDAPAQVVRLRVLNGSNVRSYNLGFSDNRTFYVIASDGGLVAQPVPVTRLKIASGERYEILLDLTNDQGNNFVMMSYASAFSTTEPGGGGMPNGASVLNAVDFGIMQINVVAPTGNPVTTIPSSLITVTPWNVANVNTIRYKTLDGNGMFATMANFTINLLEFDMMVINDTIPLNNLEMWQFTNNTNIAHPIHIHDVPFYILSRNGNQPPVYEEGLKDVFYIMPNEVVQVIMKFENFTNDSVPYMYHCHNLVHEDNGMMAQFIVTDTLTGIGEIATGNVLLYPNPTASSVQLQFDATVVQPCTVALYDVNGRLLESEVILPPGIGFKYCVDMTTRAAGIYFLKITGDNVSRTVTIVRE